MTRYHRLKALVPMGAACVPIPPLCADPYCLMDGIVRSEGEGREAFVSRLRTLYTDGHLGVPSLGETA